jgi:hypothetical protein
MKMSFQATDPKGPSPFLTRIVESVRELFLSSYILDIDVLLDNLGKGKKERPVT